MILNKEEVLSKRLKNTLTQFTENYLIGSNTTKNIMNSSLPLNKTITDYKSIRNLQKDEFKRKISNNKIRKISVVSTSKAQSHKKEDSYARLPTGDLIDIIKIKLSQNEREMHLSERMKTDYGFDKSRYKPFYLQRKKIQFSEKKVPKKNELRKKKVDFLVKNSQAYTEKTCGKDTFNYNQIYINLIDRPKASIGYHINELSISQQIARERKKKLSEERRQKRLTSKKMPMTVNDRVKTQNNFCGWETNQYVQDYF